MESTYEFMVNVLRTANFVTRDQRILLRHSIWSFTEEVLLSFFVFSKLDHILALNDASTGNPQWFLMFQGQRAACKAGRGRWSTRLGRLGYWSHKIPWDGTGICSYIYLIKNEAFMIHGSVNIPGKLHGLFGYGKALICFFKNPQQQKKRRKNWTMKTWENRKKEWQTSHWWKLQGDEWLVGWSLVCFSSGQHGTFELVAAKVGCHLRFLMGNLDFSVNIWIWWTKLDKENHESIRHEEHMISLGYRRYGKIW